MKKILLFIGCFLSIWADAHSEITLGFWSGFQHPILGFDHLLAMVSVGVISVQMGGRSIWAVPCAFVLAMIGGGVFGMTAFPALNLEMGIALSVVLLGIGIAFGRKIPIVLSYLFVVLFGFFHGYAHGIEMPDFVISWFYILGFVLSTSVLHLMGVGAGIVCSGFSQRVFWFAVAGGLICMVGLGILVDVF